MTIILYTRRNVGLYALSYLKAKGLFVKVVTDDLEVFKMAGKLNCEVVSLADALFSLYDYFFCVHGNQVIPKDAIKKYQMVNFHPCLTQYKGANPIKRYIENKDRYATVGCHYITEEVDVGEIVHQEFFITPEVKSYAEFYNIAVPYYFKCFDAVLEKLNIKP